MKKSISIVIVLLLTITYSYGEERKENSFLVGIGTINLINSPPYGAYLYGGYEYILTQTSKGKFYWALEGRLTNGFISKKSDYNNLIIGLSILPRLYLNVKYFDIFLFVEGEIGGCYQYVNSSGTGGKANLMYGTRFGVKANRLSLWTGILDTGAKAIIEDIADISYVNSSIGVFGVTYSF